MEKATDDGIGVPEGPPSDALVVLPNLSSGMDRLGWITRKGREIMDITNQIFEPRHRIMNPEHEDLLYGTDLREGMIVLLSDTLLKSDPEHVTSDYDRMRLMQVNRWCSVTRLRIIPREDSPLIKFMGEYHDGTKLDRTYDASYTWIVKRDSIVNEMNK